MWILTLGAQSIVVAIWKEERGIGRFTVSQNIEGGLIVGTQGARGVGEGGEGVSTSAARHNNHPSGNAEFRHAPISLQCT